MATKVALLIGVSEYSESDLKPLPSAAKDVQEMERVLKQSCEFSAEQIQVLTNPQKQEVEEAIYWLFADRQKDDLLLFYFSGHGIKDDTGRLYFSLPATCKNDRGELKDYTAVSATILHERMNRSRSTCQVLVLDCCFSGAFAKGLTAKDGGSVNIPAQLGGKGRAIFTSSNSIEYSFQQDSLTLSVYTHFFVEGLETGAADLDGDGLISADDLHTYVSKKVKQTAPAMTPQFYPVEQGYKIYLTRSARVDSSLQSTETVAQSTQPASVSYERRHGSSILTTRVEPLLHVHRSNLNAVVYPLNRRRLIKLISFAGIGVGTVGVSSLMRLLYSSQFPSANRSLTPELATTTSSTGVQSFIEKLEDGVTLEMVKIPSGKFKMGSLPTEAGHISEEGPQHEVTVPGFAIGKYPVTQAQWRAVAALPAVNRNLNPTPAYFQSPDHPVEQISWLDAIEFCVRLSQKMGRSYRLPTEAEWEYACRAGTTTPYYFGGTITKEQVNYSSSTTTPVGSFTANAFGLYDMHGNVWECCADYWRRNYEGAPADGSARSDPNLNYARVIRGGSWASEASQCRSAKRTWYVESTTLNLVFKRSEFGMRVACSI